MRGASRFETFIATFVGVCALCVSAYTAYMQRQQVRAAVWPILEFDSSNEPGIHFNLSNKGVGPAIIRDVVVKVDGQRVSDWHEVLQKFLGAGVHHYLMSNMAGRVLSPGESVEVFTPRSDQGAALGDTDPLWSKLNNDRERLTVEICYSSSLGECWRFQGGGMIAGATTEVSGCHGPPAGKF